MKYLKVLLISVTICLVSACGGGGGNSKESDGQNSANLTNSIYGLWRSLEENVYLEITETTYTSYAFEDYGCYEKIQSNILDNTGDEFRLGTQNVEFTLTLKAINNVLTIIDHQNDISININRANDISEVSQIFPKCSDSTATGAISASITFANLPETIQLYHPDTPTFQSEFSIEVTFDTNNNNVIDKGDIAIDLMAYKENGATPNVISLNKLTAILQIHEDENTLTRIASANFSIDNNIITFHINKSDHYVLTGISQGTQIVVSARYDYDQYQYDSYPDSDEYTSGVDTSHLVDAIDDARPIDAIFDITEIKITVTD